MLKFLTASTAEVDDPEAAVAEILEQLDLANGLLTRSIGIITCYKEFISIGTLDALCGHLPFDIVGCTVLGSATGATYGMEQLSITVLTSDEIQFSVSLSQEITKDNSQKFIEETWRQARDKLPDDPGLCIAFFPLLDDVSGGLMLRQLDTACGGLPIFGTLSNDALLDTQACHTFLNGEAHPRRFVLLLLHGALTPRFYTASISPKNVRHQKAIVTQSDGYLVNQVNNMPFIDYLASIGVQKETLIALTTLPFMVDYGDGSPPVVLAIYSISPDGVLSSGQMPVGAVITFMEIDYDSVMETAESALQLALEDVEKNRANGILAIPCLSRSMMISPNVEAEMQKTTALLSGRLPYMLLYSGGEICPMRTAAGVLVNRFHNFTYTLAIL